MGNIIGQQVDLGVDEQIKHRQQVFGAGYNDKSEGIADGNVIITNEDGATVAAAITAIATITIIN